MDFIVDHAVALSAVALALLVLGGLVVLAIAGWRLWRVVRAAEKRLGEAGRELAAEGDRLTAALDAMPARQAEIQASLSALSQRAAVLSVLARYASHASAVLRSPLSYLGR